MLRVKKTCEIDVARLMRNVGDGSVMSSFQVLENGNVAMIFMMPSDEKDRIRYTVKIHNRLGIQRQCSFTAVESRLLNVMLHMNELYGFMSGSSEEDVSINRIEPVTKENVVPMRAGAVRQAAGTGSEDFLVNYEDGTVIRYLRGKQDVIRPAGGRACISMDFNKRYMIYDGKKITRSDDPMNRTYAFECDDVEGFVLGRSDRSVAVCAGGRLVEYEKSGDVFVPGESITDFKIDSCSMLRDTAALLSDDVIYVYKID